MHSIDFLSLVCAVKCITLAIKSTSVVLGCDPHFGRHFEWVTKA